MPNTIPQHAPPEGPICVACVGDGTQWAARTEKFHLHFTASAPTTSRRSLPM